MSESELASAVEILPDRLYWVALRHAPRQSSTQHFFCIDNELVYWNFFLDFGPLNLGQTYRFCQILNAKLEDRRLSSKTIYFYCGAHPHKRANSAFLVACWAMFNLNQTPDEAFRPFRGIYPPFPPFHDASPCVCTYNLSVLDCLRGVAKAQATGFLDWDNFDVEEYEHFEKVENGDLNVVARNKFIAFAGPHNTHSSSPDGYYTFTPEDYLPLFRRKNVQMVIRLNKKYYDERRFTNAGLRHVECFFTDGSCPPERVLKKFLEECESVPGAIAVHCKAGLGRTGTCIGCYLMKHHRWTAAEVIGWFRVVRPGSIIGPQQHYLANMESKMWRAGEIFRKRQQRDAGAGASASASASASAEDVETVSRGVSQMTVERRRRSSGGSSSTVVRRSSRETLTVAAGASAGLPAAGRSSSRSSLTLSSSTAASAAAASSRKVTQGDELRARRAQGSPINRDAARTTRRDSTGTRTTRSSRRGSGGASSSSTSTSSSRRPAGRYY